MSDLEKSNQKVKKLLWIGNAGDYSSFSRVTSSIVPTISEKIKVTLLVTPKGELSKKLIKENIHIVKLGEDTKKVTWEEFKYSWDMMFNTGQQTTKSDSVECHMKYCILQIADLNIQHHFDYIVICNGIYEANWFVQTILESKINDDSRTILEFKRDFKESNDSIKKKSEWSRESEWSRSELVVWTPIDYIPTLPVVRWVLEADYLFTMNPVMKDELIKLNKILKMSKETNNKMIDWVGHGSDINSDSNSDNDRNILIKKLNKLKSTIWNGSKLDSNDIIILNANSCIPRKRLDKTVLAFQELRKKDPENTKHIKLWIHTDMVKFSKMLYELRVEKKLDSKLDSNIIVSHNNVSDDMLNMIYRVCQIGIQTSTGEGFSLTNCEHASFGGLQVVPDFLATGFHFKENRGLLIPVSVEKSLNEAGHNVSVGTVEIKDVVEKLKKAIEILEINIIENSKKNIIENSKKDIIENSKKYFKSYKWSTEAEKLLNFLV